MAVTEERGRAFPEPTVERTHDSGGYPAQSIKKMSCVPAREGTAAEPVVFRRKLV